MSKPHHCGKDKRKCEVSIIVLYFLNKKIFLLLIIKRERKKTGKMHEAYTWMSALCGLSYPTPKNLNKWVLNICIFFVWKQCFLNIKVCRKWQSFSILGSLVVEATSESCQVDFFQKKLKFKFICVKFRFSLLGILRFVSIQNSVFVGKHSSENL